MLDDVSTYWSKKKPFSTLETLLSYVTDAEKIVHAFMTSRLMHY